MQRQPITLPGDRTHSDVYVADTYVFNKPNKQQRYLQHYALDTYDYKACYFPVNSFGRRESKLNLTHDLMQHCIDRKVPIILETRTDIPDWAVSLLARSRGSQVIVQVPTLRATQKRKYFTSYGHPDDMRDLILAIFRTGTNVRLKFAPIIPTVAHFSELVMYMDGIRSFLHGVDIAFSRLLPKDIERIERRNRLNAGSLLDKYDYDADSDSYYIKPAVKERVMAEFRAFCEGNGLQLNEY